MRRRALVVGTALLVGVSGAGAAPAFAAESTAPAAAAAGPQASVTLQLAQPHQAAVEALASNKNLAHGSRVAALRSLLPSAASKQQVATIARSEGLTVDSTGATTVSVSGPASTVHALFGDATPATSGGRRRDLHVPGALTGLVAQVVSGSDGPTLHPLAVSPVTGGQIAAASHVTVAPPVGGSTQTVATIQLSGWNPAALTQFASNHGLANPLTNGQYTAISVGGSTTTTPDGQGGDTEVALDQEAVLATAPYAKQRAYFATNGGSAGNDFFAAFNAVLTDALSTAPDYDISALSVSWGGCEAEQWSDSDMDAFDATMASLEAAGVTVFAASGDSGSYGCAQPQTTSSDNKLLSVDFPASSPHVVGVGGTSFNHTATPSAPTESVWWWPTGDPNVTQYQGAGSGGGVSGHFAKPSYQSAITLSTKRMVPDISMDGDPDSGLPIVYYSGATLKSATYGGTSLSAPLAAATYTDLLGSKGLSHGLGNISAGLYSASATAFRDVTAGTNGAYAARAGFDETTGRGTPLWTELAPSVVPQLSVSVPLVTTSTTIPLTITTPGGATITGWAAGVGTPPADCSTATSATVPTSVVAPGAGVQTVWVRGVAEDNCYLATASVTVTPTSTYTAVAPFRVADTRKGLGGHGVLGAHSSMTIQVTGGSSPVPAGATAAAVNVAVTGATASGFLSVAPALSTTTSNLNFAANETIPNLVISKLSPTGTLTIYNGGNGSVQVLVDVQGYLTPDAAGSTYVPLAPTRILDTRKGVGAAAAIPAFGSITLQVTGGVVPANQPAAALNVTVTGPTRGGFLSVAPALSTSTSNLNFVAGSTVANLVVTKLSATGTVTIYNGSIGTVNVLADVQGYLTDGAPQSTFLPVTPVRVLDTRKGIGHSGAIPGGGSLVVHVTPSGYTVPPGATAVVVNVTAVNELRGGYLSVGPASSSSTSNLNFLAGEIRPNLVISRLSGDTVTVYNGSVGTVDVLVDVQGYLVSS